MGEGVSSLENICTSPATTDASSVTMTELRRTMLLGLVGRPAEILGGLAENGQQVPALPEQATYQHHPHQLGGAIGRYGPVSSEHVICSWPTCHPCPS